MTPQEWAHGSCRSGLFFEAARWDDEKWQIEESYPKILFEKMPMSHRPRGRI